MKQVAQGIGFLAAGVLVTMAVGVGAQPFPAKPVEVVVHTGPGGGADIFARQVADIITREKMLSQPLVIQNRVGGGGALALSHVAGRKADPYSILTVVASLMLAIPVRSGQEKEMGLDKFQPLALLGFDLNCVAVRADSPYKTVKDLVDAARANPKTINISLGSIGGASHYLPYSIEKLANVRFNLVSMKSGAEAVTAVLGGHTHATTEQLSEMIPYIEAGRIRILGVAATKRIAGIPNVPTLKEQGLDLHVGAGRGFWAPAGIPKDAAATLEGTFEKVYKTTAWREYLNKSLYEDIYMGSAEFGKFLVRHQPEMTQYMTDLGLANRK